MNRMARLRALATTVGALLATGSLSAQTDPRLTGAIRLAQDGLSDSARAVVSRLLSVTSPTDSLYPEVLFTMGFVAANEADRRLHLRRVAVDYPQSAWADDALLQLAQLDYAAGNSEGTVRQVEQLLRDYPESSLTAAAAFWGARAAGDRRDPATACRLADVGLATSAGQVEIRNQLEFQKQRCQGLATMAVNDSIERARADSIARTSPRRNPTSTRPPARPSAGFYVQVSAVRTQAAAATELARLKRAGYAGVTAPDGGLLKIRAGPFTARPDADAALRDIRSKLGGQPFVVRVP